MHGFFRVWTIAFILGASYGTASGKTDPENQVRSVFLTFQKNLRQGNLEEAYTFLGETLRGCFESRDAFIRSVSENPDKLKLICELKILHVKVKENRAVIITDSSRPQLHAFELHRTKGGWKLEGMGEERSVYPQGKEKEFAEATRGFAELCFLRERVRFLKDVLVRRRYYQPQDATGLKDRCSSLVAALAFSKNIILSRQEQYRTLIAKPGGGVTNLTTKLEQDLALFRERFDTHFSWAEQQKIWLPEPPQSLGFDSGPQNRLHFGVIVRYFNYEAYPAWQILGFDFICIDTGWGPAFVGWESGEPNFTRISEYVKRNAEFGYHSDMGQAGLGALSFCLWHPRERMRWQKYFVNLGALFSRNPAVLCYEIFNEPDNRPFQQERGENRKYAVEAFRGYLVKKYGTIRALNKAWKTDFTNFNQIAGALLEPGFRPPQRDFRRFLQESLADFLDLCLQALKKSDPNHPVLTQMSEFGGRQDGFLVGNKAVDCFSLHMTFGGPPGGPNNMAQAAGLARFVQKPLWQEEFIFNWPEATRSEEIDELSAAINRNVWQALGWGFKAIQFFELDNQWQGWRNSLLDRKSGYGIIRPESARISVAISVARRLENVLLETKLAPAEIGIIDSPSTRLVPSARKRYGPASARLEKLLFHKGWSYTVLPEAGLAKRPELWEGLQVVVLPECEYLDASAAKALERYVAQGGTLIRIGRGGILDEAGSPTQLSRILRAGNREFDRGRVFSVIDSESEKARETLGELFERVLGRPRLRINPPGQVQVFFRQKGAVKYLFLVNLSPLKEVTAEVSIIKRLSGVTDLVAQATIRVVHKGEASELALLLEPGGVAVLRLEVE